MADFVIIHKEGRVSIYEYFNKSFEVLKYNGEKEHDFDPEIFWKWWKDKAKYDGKAVSFTIITDLEQFQIPSELNISSKIPFTQKEFYQYFENYYEGMRVISYPPGFHLEKLKDKATPKEKTLKHKNIAKEKKEPSKSILLEALHKKTQQYLE